MPGLMIEEGTPEFATELNNALAKNGPFREVGGHIFTCNAGTACCRVSEAMLVRLAAPPFRCVAFEGVSPNRTARLTS